MGKSGLTQVTVPASVSNYTQGRRGKKVCKITVHHMAGVLSAEQCGKIFQAPGRQASSNYGIGNDGKIACYVGEENRAWTSSNAENDCQAITIEVSNSSTGGNWPVSAAAWKSLVNLCVDICKRYGFRLVYDGTKNGSLTRHNMFANTNCPGEYLQSKFPQLVQEVNARLDEKVETTTSNDNSYLVKVTANGLNIRKGVGTGTAIVGCITDKGTYTIVETKGNWGKLKSGAGWICLDYTQRVNETNNITYTVKSGDTLSEIAQKFGTTYQEIAQKNGITNPDKIDIGQVLKI